MAGILWARNGSKAPDLAGFKVQSSVAGLPIPIIYGTARVAGNLIDFVQGPAVPVLSQRSKWTSATQTGWTYYNALALALCEGEIAGIGNVWADKDAKKDFATVIQPQDLWTLKKGTIAPSALGYLSSTAPYQFVAYVAVESLAMPNNILPNYSWEVQGLLIFGSGVVDALPSDVLSDMLTNVTHGMAFPSSSLDSLTLYADYCAAAGLFVSPVFSAIRKGSDAIDELMQSTNSAVVWSDGLLKVKPYGDIPLSGHGHTYTPDTTPIYDIDGDRDCLGPEGTDPIVVTKKNPNECYNQLFLEFENRASDYNTDVKEAKNDDSILSTRLLPAPKVSLTMIKDGDVARTVAQLIQQREQFVVNSYEFSLGWKYSLLEPMDLITLTDVGLGLSFTPVRITEVVELEDAAGIQITAEDWPFGAASATLYPSETNDGHKPANNVAPGDTVAMMFNGPGSLTINSLEIWIAASGGDFWGGCEVWLSADLGLTYYKYGRMDAKSTFGVLTADLDTGTAYPGTDSVNTLSVDVTTSGGALADQTADDFAALTPLCYVDTEFVAFKDAALTSAFNYDLTTLYRALRGSAQTATPGHLIGSQFAFIDPSVFKLFFPQGYAGQVLYFKFPAFNIYGNALQSLADATPVVYTVQTPAGSTFPTIDSVTPTVTSSPCDGGGTMTVAWTTSNMPGGESYNVDIYVEGGTRGASERHYTGVTSGDTLNADLCGDSFGHVVVTAVTSHPIASGDSTF